MQYDVIISARNEAATVADVIRPAREAAQRVIVVDDHSDDDTAGVAREAGADVILSRGRGSKALAMATGVAASSAEVIVFFDGDITGVQPGHFDLLARPVVEKGFAMSCGIVDYGSIRNTIFLRLPPITGLRAVRRDVFTAIPEEKLNGFQIEIMINEVVSRGGMRTAIRVLRGTDHISKVTKLGPLAGTRAHLSMTMELLGCFRLVPLWTYGSYLRNLTVLADR
jgi:glycosyltransferase involved in cell wall biosynthesis